jgi:hypothetical protein
VGVGLRCYGVTFTFLYLKVRFGLRCYGVTFTFFVVEGGPSYGDSVLYLHFSWLKVRFGLRCYGVTFTFSVVLVKHFAQKSTKIF